MLEIEGISSKLRHPGWEWARSAFFFFLGALAPEAIRALALLAAVIIGTYALGRSELARSRKAVTITGFVLFSLLATLLFVGARWLDTRDPIRVSPASVNAEVLAGRKGSPLEGSLDVSVYNRTGDPYYQIWAKIRLKSRTIGHDRVTLDFPSIQQQSSDVQARYVCLEGFDAQQYWGYLCFIDELSPGERFAFRLNYKSGADEPAWDDLGVVQTTIVHYESTPAQVERKKSGEENYFSLQTPLPETFTWTSLIVYCTTVSQPVRYLFKCTPKSMKK